MTPALWIAALSWRSGSSPSPRLSRAHLLRSKRPARAIAMRRSAETPAPCTAPANFFASPC